MGFTGGTRWRNGIYVFFLEMNCDISTDCLGLGGALVHTLGSLFWVLNYCSSMAAAVGVRDGNEISWLLPFSSFDLCSLKISVI